MTTMPSTVSLPRLQGCSMSGKLTRSLLGYLALAGRAATGSRAVGIVFAVAFAAIATGSASAAINLSFTAAVIVSYAWLRAAAAGLYRRTRLDEPGPAGLPTR